MKEKKTKVCMIVQDKMVKGGIAAVISGYYGSKLEDVYKRQAHHGSGNQ